MGPPPRTDQPSNVQGDGWGRSLERKTGERWQGLNQSDGRDAECWGLKILLKEIFQ